MDACSRPSWVVPHPTGGKVLMLLTHFISAFGVVVVGAVVGAEFPAVVNEAFSVPDLFFIRDTRLGVHRFVL